MWDDIYVLYGCNLGNPMDNIKMNNHQKSHKEYIHSIPLEPKLSEIPLPHSIDDVCIWWKTGDCIAAGLRTFLNRKDYNGKSCKCYAYLSYKGEKK